MRVWDTLTLLMSGILKNEGTLQVGRFVRENGNGGTILGNPPTEVGLPGQGITPVIVSLHFTNPTIEPASAKEETSPAAMLVVWIGTPNRQFSLEFSRDLVHWEHRPATVETLGTNLYRARINDTAQPMGFIRVTELP